MSLSPFPDTRFSTTIVSAFYDIYDSGSPVGWTPDRQKHAAKLLSLDCPIVLFLEPDASKSIRQIASGRPNVHIIDRHLSSLSTTRVITNSGLTGPPTDNPTKDTVGFLNLMHCKSELVGIAAEVNPHKTTHFAWIDLCINKLFRNDQSLVNLSTSLASPTKSSVLLIPGCWHSDYGYVLTPDRVHWRFAGTVFLADHSSALSFSSVCLSHLESFLTESGIISWEVNYWAWLERKQLLPSCFTWKYTDHNDSMADSLHLT